MAGKITASQSPSEAQQQVRVSTYSQVFLGYTASVCSRAVSVLFSRWAPAPVPQIAPVQDSAEKMMESFLLICNEEAEAFAREREERTKQQQEVEQEEVRIEAELRRKLSALKEARALSHTTNSGPLNFSVQTLARILKATIPESRQGLIDSLLKEGKLVTSIESHFNVGTSEPIKLIVSAAIERNQGNIEAVLIVPECLSCRAVLTLPPSKAAQEEMVLLHPELIVSLRTLLRAGSKSQLTKNDLLALMALVPERNAELKSKLAVQLQQIESTKPIASVEEILQLILSILARNFHLKWTNTNSRGVAEFKFELPGNANFTIDLKSPLNLRRALHQSPAFIEERIEEIMANFSLMFKKLLERDMEIRWEGGSQRFQIDWTPRSLVVNRIKLMSKGFLANVAEGIVGGIEIILPAQIKGRVIFSGPAISFAEVPLKVIVDRPHFPKFEAVVKEISYIPDKQILGIAFRAFFMDNNIAIDMSTSIIKTINLDFKDSRD